MLENFASWVKINSVDVESYHSWSSNSKWFVFSSKRLDGMYSRPFFCYIDEHGNASKPFLLPQKSPDYYISFTKNFNIPELVMGKVPFSEWELSKVANDKANFVNAVFKPSVNVDQNTGATILIDSVSN